MKVLQITNDFAGSKVHSNLFKKLDDLGVEQVVYCPIRSENLFDSNRFEGLHIDFIYSYVIRPWYKYFYHYKKRVLYSDMKNKVDLSSIDLIHAATLFSDGALAYEAYKEYDIPYVLAVRNTDINAFAKLQPHTWAFGRKILLHASKIYFISKALQSDFEQLMFVQPVLDVIRDKMVLRPNGVATYWLEHVQNLPTEGKDVLYIGDFSDNKNIIRLISAIKEIRLESEFKDLGLTIIGGGKEHGNTVSDAIKRENFISYLGKIYDKSKLDEVMRSHALFAMPSIHETFGLVYIESLSQNLPVVYSVGQGIDKLFDNENNPVGEGVEAKSVQSIKNAILLILRNRKMYSNRQVDFSMFDWNSIASSYCEDYKFILIGYRNNLN